MACNRNVRRKFDTDTNGYFSSLPEATSDFCATDQSILLQIQLAFFVLFLRQNVANYPYTVGPTLFQARQKKNSNKNIRAQVFAISFQQKKELKFLG